MTSPVESPLFTRHLASVRAFLLARCRDADLADELTQEVAARISTTTIRLDPAGNMGGYLVQTARNVWRDWLRHELVRRRATAAIVAEGTPTATPADTAVLAAEMQTALRRAIQALPPNQRDVVELRHREELTFQQIADRLHRPLGTVLTQMRSAMHRMHEMMEAYR